MFLNIVKTVLRPKEFVAEESVVSHDSFQCNAV